MDPGAYVTEPSWQQPQSCSLLSISGHLAAAGPLEEGKQRLVLSALTVLPRPRLTDSQGQIFFGETLPKCNMIKEGQKRERESLPYK